MNSNPFETTEAVLVLKGLNKPTFFQNRFEENVKSSDCLITLYKERSIKKLKTQWGPLYITLEATKRFLNVKIAYFCRSNVCYIRRAIAEAHLSLTMLLEPPLKLE